MRFLSLLFLLLTFASGVSFGKQKQKSKASASSGKNAISKESSNDTIVKKIRGFGKGGLSEFLNVETRFVFVRDGSTDDKIVKIYSPLNKASQDYRVPVYPIADELSFDLEFVPTILKSYELDVKRICQNYGANEIEIPVEIRIEGCSNVDVIKTEFASKFEQNELSNDKAVFVCTINNEKSKLPYVRFSLKKNEIGNASVHVVFGTSDYKIVDKTCDVFETIKFISK